jgi:C4-type Zn-finger protein
MIASARSSGLNECPEMPSIMGAEPRRAPTLSCPRCGAAMEAIVSIEPTLGEPGLIGYECPKCVYVTSELVQPTGSAKPVR